MTSPAWLVDLVAGQTWRFASREIRWNGHTYADGLGVSDGGVDVLSFAEPTERAIQVTINAQHVPAFDVDDVAIGATATVYYWHDPDGTEDPVIAVAGVVEDPEYGGDAEPLTATVREVPWDDRGLLPDARAKVDDETWPDHDPAIRGEFYPIVFGAPGVVDSGGSSAGFGSPALYVDTGGGADLVLLAGHPVAAATVVVRDITAGTAGVFNVQHQTDGLGRRVAVTDLTADRVSGSLGAAVAGNEYWTRWSGSAGGLPSLTTPAVAMTGAGDVIEWLLHRSTIRVDWGRLRAAAGRLNAYKIDTYVQADPEERVKPWEWIADQLLPLLPVAVRTGPKGAYLAVFDPASQPKDVRGRLEAGRNCDRISPISVVGTADVANDFVLAYAAQAEEDTFYKEVRVTGSRATMDAYASSRRSAICQESVRRFGVVVRELTAAAIYDPSTAARVLTAMAAREALPAREVAYAVDDDADLRDLEPGDPVAITDASLGWSSRVAYVWSVRVAAEREVVLRLWHQIGRDKSSAG